MNNTDPLYSFQLPRGLLKALALFQSNDETRLALQCTCFEIRPGIGDNREATLVSCDGRRLASHRAEVLRDTVAGEMPEADTFVVDLKGCAKLPKISPIDCVTVEVHAARVEFVADKIRYTARRVETPEVGIQFPNWRELIPARAPERVDQIAVSHSLLGDFGKAAKLTLGDKGYGLVLSTYGHGAPISVQFLNHREFFGIIMPLRTEHPEAFPTWLAEEKKKGAKTSPADQQPEVQKQAA